MAQGPLGDAEAERLEALWAGSFGDDYVARNAAAGNVREEFWRDVLDGLDCRRVLEVGCNLGGNLRWVAQLIDPVGVFGIDVNRSALAQLRTAWPDVNALWGTARELPFRDRWFDLVFTMGVLIHQPEEALPAVMDEIVRCADRFVLCGEYHSDTTVEVPYRGHDGALFKRDYARLYQERYPELQLLHSGFLGQDRGWDDVTWSLFAISR